MPKPVYEEGNVTVVWKQAVHTDKEVTANRPGIIIKNKKEKTIPADRNVLQKEAEKKLKQEQEFRYRDTTNMEPEMYDYTSY
jgi:hypothetical protein